MSFKKTKVVMLPTNEKAGLGSIYKRIKDDEIGNIDEFDRIGKLFINKNPNVQKSNSNFEAQHLYFLSYEEIKEGDWIYDEDNGVVKIEHKYQLSNINVFRKDCKKIIATTDKSLSEQIMYYPNGAIIGGIESYKLLPQPSQSFIEKFVEEYNKGNVITEVLVEYEEIKVLKQTLNEGFGSYYHKAESEFVLKVNPKVNTIAIRKVKDSWNRDEVVELLSKHFVDAGSKIGLGQDVTKFTEKWIEKNL